MALTASQIADNIILQWKLLDPAVSAEVGTPERKLIDTFSEALASAQVDFSVLDAQHNLDAMSGGRLDAYLGNLGFARQLAIPAIGSVTFSRTATATSDIIIPEGTQVVATVQDPNFPDIVFVTTQTVTLPQGGLSVDAPVQCATSGTVGNVPAGAVHDFGGLKSIVGITSVTNTNPMTGGTDGETDAELKTRFQNTIFRNQAGTYDQFLALAVALNSVTKANVVGPISRYQEYIQVPATNDTVQATIAITDNNHVYSSGAGGYDQAGTGWPHKRTSAVSTIPYSKYTYDQQYYITDGNLGTNATFLRPFVDYVFNRVPLNTNETIATTPAANNQPNVTFLKTLPTDSDANPLVTQNGVLLLEHAYISKNSRNDYYKGIMNCVDIFINGENPTTASSQEVMAGTSNVVQNSDTSKWSYQSNFTRTIDGTAPANGSKIVPLYWQPVTDVPDSIKISDGTKTFTFYKAKYKISGSYYYNLNADGTGKTLANYWAVQEVTGYYGTIRARNGIEFSATAGGYDTTGNADATRPATAAQFVGQQFSVKNYTYDKNVSDLQAVTEKNKQITTDVLIHKAKVRYFKLNVTIMYAPGSTQAVVNASINVAVDQFFQNQYYGAAIQLSDLLQTIHNVPGVDNVRWTYDTNNSIAKVQESYKDGTNLGSAINTDFYIQDNELAASPDNNQVTVTVRAQNTWGT